ncbi:HpcH/HpaI aldolase family protein [Lawsonibacter celer]|jgi:2-keto-3-deoxy-L-rhamnonate aldolase RhmA|uniref:HpcH/HpaI aldolase family protein n=1 Tax=Lawsonibacter celer TaxID=2986526 RepID=UPI001648325E|nr:aldolase/citrate lyase family protein [Lawsonibacter celer]
MQMRNFVKEKIAANGYVLGAFVASSSATNCEILAINGLDFVLIDCEHAQTDAETLVHMCRASEMYGMAPLMRVYNPDDGPMMSRMLDVGLHGVMAPLINTPAQAQNLVNFTKYAPLGKRGANGGRGPRWGNYPDYVHTCNDNVLTIAQCESVQGVKNIEEIAAIPGIDCIFIGTGDLSLDMGIQFKADSSASHSVDSPEMVAAIDKVLKACQKNHVIPGIVTASAEDAARRVKQGFQFVTCMNDLGFFSSRSKQHLSTIRDQIAHG